MVIQSPEPDAESDGSGPQGAPSSKKRTRVARPYPVNTLEEATVVPSAIHETNAGLPLDRVLLAKALGTTPASSGFVTKLNSSAKYGLTQGGYNDERIALTQLGLAVIAPKQSEERKQALTEAALQPDVFKRFYELLNGNRLPEDLYAKNMLQRDLEIMASLTDECLRIVKANGVFVGILGEVGSALYVSLSGEHALDEKHLRAPPARRKAKTQPPPAVEEAPTVAVAEETAPAVVRVPTAPEAGSSDSRIYIGHAGSPTVAEYLKATLEGFDIPCEVAESHQDDDLPITAGLSEQMRRCDAAVLVFGDSSHGARVQPGAERMMYQLGAASMLYGDRVVSLAESGPKRSRMPGGAHVLEFRQGGLGELALALLAELRKMGVIELRVSSPGLAADIIGR